MRADRVDRVQLSIHACDQDLRRSGRKVAEGRGTRGTFLDLGGVVDRHGDATEQGQQFLEHHLASCESTIRGCRERGRR
jgi:hypothetical protein